MTDIELRNIVIEKLLEIIQEIEKEQKTRPKEKSYYMLISTLDDVQQLKLF